MAVLGVPRSCRGWDVNKGGGSEEQHWGCGSLGTALPGQEGNQA